MKNLGKSPDIVGRRGDSPASAWIPIASKARTDSEWTELPDAPMTCKEALNAEAAGRLFFACRYTVTQVTALIQHRAPKE